MVNQWGPPVLVPAPSGVSHQLINIHNTCQSRFNRTIKDILLVELQDNNNTELPLSFLILRYLNNNTLVNVFYLRLVLNCFRLLLSCFLYNVTVYNSYLISSRLLATSCNHKPSDKLRCGINKPSRINRATMKDLIKEINSIII